MMIMRIALSLALLGAVSLAPVAASADGQYLLPFTTTVNAPGGQLGGATGLMDIRVANGKSTVTLKVRNLYPNALYTIWTVFGHLPLNPDGTVPDGHAPVQCSPQPRPMPDAFASEAAYNAAVAAYEGSPLCKNSPGWAGFPAEGHRVAPTAKITSKFTDGMGLDPGATFLTNRQGEGQVTVALDYDIMSTDTDTAAPIGNKHSITQIVAGVPSLKCTTTTDGVTTCVSVAKDANLNVTTTYLRRFVNEFNVADRPAMCSNYDPLADPDVQGYDENGIARTDPLGADARLWQCVDPATKMPRVARFGWDHFRLANHVDDLTHGFIGGNGTDHVIDMVGLRACVIPLGAAPSVQPLPPSNGVPIATTCPTIGTSPLK